MTNDFKIEIIPWELTFKRPARTSRGVYVNRKLWYLRIGDAIGECAPLPDLSCEYSDDYEDLVRRACQEVEENGKIDFERLRPYPSILFGLETVMRHHERRDWRLFDTPFSHGEIGIPINGLIWMGDYDYMLQQIETKMDEGFRCVKLKIGAIDFDRELSLLKHIRSHFSAKEIELRVDANGAFSPKEALDRLKQLAELELHSIEQPIRAGQWDEMARLSSETPLPIALDEELIGVNDLASKRELLSTIRPQYIILKPSLHGGMAGCEEWIRLANEILTKDNSLPKWWVTSALESQVGLNAISQWCATLGNPLPQGLGTGEIFLDDKRKLVRREGDTIWFNGKG